jgi:predicted phosphate transport protein (TIGR00153 family)
MANNFNFFARFEKMADYSCQAAQMLSKTLENFNNKSLDERVKEMHVIENAADKEKYEIVNRLAKEFITPIEREDILDIIDNLDDLTDFIEDVMITMYMYNINSLRKEIFLFSEVINKCCYAIKDIFAEFSNFRKSSKISDLIIAVNRLEEEADKIYINSVKNLFASSNDAIEIMKWREIFDRAEKCCDTSENIANSIEGIVMKNS